MTFPLAVMTGWVRYMLLYVNGPRLYHVEEGAAYTRNWLELVPDLYIKCVTTLTGIVKWTFPIWVTAAYRRGYFNREKLMSLFMFVSGVTASIVIAQMFRGLGRATNPSYRKFLEVLMKAQARNTAEMREELIKYDFDFHAWPTDFNSSREAIEVGRIKTQTQACYSTDTGIAALLSFPVDVAGWLLAHTVGIRMTYPGVILSPLLKPALADARQKLIAEHGVERIKIVTENGLEIEALFVDRRSQDTPNKDVMVVCCEGNAGFPEVGCPLVPLRLGYSVIGWNHPGFAGSTGLPYPGQEQDAVDAVVQFARARLGFEEEQLLFHGWSIGGYSASWAAMNYPRARAVILDATFDNNEELSVNAMPAAFSAFVRRTVRRHICLNVDHQLLRYPGPILLIRRTMDEIIATENRHVSSNRGNYLLLRLLEHRYPKLVSADAMAHLNHYLSVVSDSDRDQILQEAGVDSTACLRLLRNHFSAAEEPQFPSRLGALLSETERRRMLLFLASKYLHNFEATHCTPLKPEMFVDPWSEREAVAKFAAQAPVGNSGTSGNGNRNGDGGAANGNSSSGSDWERVDSEHQ